MTGHRQPSVDVGSHLDAARAAIQLCRELAHCSEESGVTTRTFLCAPMRDVHVRLTAWMTRLGMRVRVDAAGNLRGVHPGLSATAPRLLIGSHLDTVARAGAFDGVLGVVLGIALIELLESRRLPFAIEVIGFSEEEGVRFGVPFIGSRALAGQLESDLLDRCDARGCSVRQAIRDYGLDAENLADAQVSDALGYLELHIEQGPVLEAFDAPLGVVTAIVGQTRAQATFTGMAGHAGTTPMRGRRDALAGAAEWIVAVEQEARQVKGLVATVGRVEVEPGASNVIAGLCRATLDVRHAADRVRRDAAARMRAAAERIAGSRGLALAWEARLDQPAVAMDPALAMMLERAVDRIGVPLHRLPSGAGHDAMILAAHMPVAMLFLRSPGGLSHHPDESVLDTDVAAALAAGLAFLDELARTIA